MKKWLIKIAVIKLIYYHLKIFKSGAKNKSYILLKNLGIDRVDQCDTQKKVCWYSNTVVDVACSIWDYRYFIVSEKDSLIDFGSYMQDFMNGLEKYIDKKKKYVVTAYQECIGRNAASGRLWQHGKSWLNLHFNEEQRHFRHGHQQLQQRQ